MNRSLIIGNIHNLSLESYSDEQPHLVEQFPCKTIEGNKCPYSYYPVVAIKKKYSFCCATIWVHNSSMLTVKRLTLQTPKCNGVYLHEVVNVTIELVEVYPNTETIITTCHGIVLSNSHFIEIYSFVAKNMSNGVYLFQASHVHMNNVTTSYNHEEGIYSLMSSHLHIFNSYSTSNQKAGITIDVGSNIVIDNVTSNANEKGVELNSIKNAQLINSIVSHNSEGIIFIESEITYIINTTVSSNTDVGINMISCSHSFLSNVTAATNGAIGVSVYKVTNVVISNTLCTSNEKGIELVKVNNSQIINSIATYNKDTGMKILTVRSINIINVTTSHNNIYGVDARQLDIANLHGITATHNGLHGIMFSLSEWTYITMLTIHSNFIAVTSTTNGQILIHTSRNILIHDTNISVDTSVASSADTITQPAVITVFYSTVNLSGCTFTGNRISAIRAHKSQLILSGELTFSNNSAYTGTAFILVEDSTLIVEENCRAYFINNRATNTGGVFTISNHRHVDYGCQLYAPKTFEKECLFTTSHCFLRAEVNKNKNKNFIFVNNSAGKGGDICHGGHIAYGFNGNDNCMDTFKHISNISETSLSFMSSDPLRVCLCNESGLPDCLLLNDPAPRYIYPGQTISISAVVVGQGWGTVAGSVYAQFLHKSTPENSIVHLKVSQVVQSTSHIYCNPLQYTIFSTNENSHHTCVLTVQDMYVSGNQNNFKAEFESWRTFYQASKIVTETIYYSTNPVYVNIFLLPCPPGFHIRSIGPFKCDCNKLLQQIPGVQCFIQEQTIHRSGLVWVGMIDEDNATNGTIAATEYCPLNYCSKGTSNVTLSEPDSQCNYNHSGTLCGGCQPGLSLALGSAQCLPCSNDYLALLIPFTLAGPVLVGFIKLLDLTVAQGTLNGLVFYANIIHVNQDIFFSWRSTHPLTFFIAWLNLDLGVETCFFNGLDAYTKTWLQFAFPLYVWSIAGLIIILAKYSDRLAKVMGNTAVPVLATLFLLSHAKLFRTIIAALSYTILCTSHSCKAVWSADGHLDYLGPRHALLFVVALVTLVFLWCPYTLLLFAGQWLHMCKSRLIVRMLIKLKPFLDAHYGALKDRHHYWFGALHIIRATVLLISALVTYNHSSVVSITIQSCSILLMLLVSIVYRNSAVSIFNMAFYMNLVLFSGADLYTKTSGGSPAVAFHILIGIAFLQFIGVVIFKMALKLKKCPKIMECVKTRRLVDDDWELYEEAALLREMESDSEEQDSGSYGSTESLPTY